jgi:hypothetical protein
MTREELEQLGEEPVVREYRYEDFGGEEEEHPAPTRRREPARSQPKPRTRARGETLPEPRKRRETEEERRRKIIEDEKTRNSFMEDLSKKFEESFNHRFDGTSLDDTRPVPDIPDFWETKTTPQPPYKAETPFLEPEAEEFVSQFMEDTQEEEENRSQEFKDTLANKFMRERERYLKELGIAQARDEERRRVEETPAPPPPEEPAPRRRLDFQIQPEMHVSDEDVTPVTYARNGKIRTPAPADTEDRRYMPPVRSSTPSKNTAASGSTLPGGKKSSEELLMELAAQTRAAEERLFRQPSSAGMALRPPTTRRQPPAPARPISEVQSAKKKRRGFPWKIVAPLAIAGLAAFAAGVWYFSDAPAWPELFAPESSVSGPSDLPNSDSADTLTVYESRDYSRESRRVYKDVLIKRSGVGVTNLSVTNLLVVSDVESAGKVTLSNVSVDGAIHVRSGAMEELELTDVQTPRVIIDNSYGPVLLRVSGNTDIGAVELKTGGTVEQANLSADALGVRGVTISAETTGSVSATLTGLSLPFLTTEGEAILQFNDTRVDAMTADGSISIDGTGKIVNLAVGAQSGVTDASTKPLDLATAIQPMAISSSANLRPLQIIINGVTVSNLNLKSAGDLTLATDIDIMAAADSLSLTGSGTVGSLSINERFGNSRLQIDLSGVRVLSMILEAESRITAGGTSKINDMTCNASTYALGNKVGTLRVNSDQVIYENEPDSIVVGQGIRPPETMAENPNLDQSLPSGQIPLPDATGDEVATTCGHTRETGGFLKGDGSKSNPYEVSTPAQLAHVGTHLESYFIQTADIDIAEDAAYSGGFESIASGGVPFSGQYDGRGHSIKNFQLTGDKARMGLFAENVGVISNVHILSGSVTSNLTATAYVGGLVGVNYEGGQILSCSNRAKVSGKENAFLGGIAGYNYGGRIRDCYNAAKITGTTHVGGIVGVNRDSGTIAGCYNVGTIEADDLAGAVVGLNEATVTNCYYLEDTAEQGIGSGTGTTIRCTSEEFQSAQIVDDLAAGNEASLWARGSSSEGAYNYPILLSPPEGE